MMDDMNMLGMYMEEAPDPRYTAGEIEAFDYSNRPKLLPDATYEQATNNKPEVTGLVFRQPL